MSEVIFKRELSHSYMVLTCEEPEITEKYAYRMMKENRIGKLLECSQRQLDGKTYLYYDISSRQPLERLYESRKMGVEEIADILRRIAAMQDDLGEYLLDEQGLLLDAGQLFADVETEELYFCFYPGISRENHRYARLADFFLEHVDHGQEHAVNVAYRFYSMSKADYFVLSAFFPFLEKERNAWKQECQKSEISFQGESEIGMAESASAKLSEQESARVLEVRADGLGEEKSGGRTKRLFDFLRFPGRKKRENHAQKEEEKKWEETIWDSYVNQIEFVKTGETIYFSDLEPPVKPGRGTPCLFEENGERQFLLEDFPLTLGKLKGKVSVVLNDSSISRMHARFESGPGGIYLQDLNSKNGTAVNGEKLSPNESVPLKEGDVIQFGRERFRYGFVDSKAVK
ncbi:MAG: FHA domain-containing protein [Lachnospiraceae bacterium]|nr:FHA domain-containing protein [Lachnospiraceae bacterium]